MKKIIGILGIVVLALTMFMNASLIIDEVSGYETSLLADANAYIKEPSTSKRFQYIVGGSTSSSSTVGTEFGTGGANIIVSGTITGSVDWLYATCCVSTDVPNNFCNRASEDGPCDVLV